MAVSQLVETSGIDDLSDQPLTGGTWNLKCAKPVWSLERRISTFTCIVICSGAWWLLACQGAKIDTLNNRIQGIQLKLSQVQTTNDELFAEENVMTPPSRILGVALGKLHMQMQTANPIHIAPSGSR